MFTIERIDRLAMQLTRTRAALQELTLSRIATPGLTEEDLRRCWVLIRRSQRIGAAWSTLQTIRDCGAGVYSWHSLDACTCADCAQTRHGYHDELVTGCVLCDQIGAQS